MGSHHHTVQFFGIEAALADAVSDFIGSALLKRHTCIMVTTPDREQLIRQRLRRRGLDLTQLAATRRFRTANAVELLASFCTDGVIDLNKFHALAEPMLQDAAEAGHPVSIYGDMVSLLAAGGHGETVIQLERLWNDLAQRFRLRLFCGYMLPTNVSAGTLLRVYDEHTDVRSVA